MRIGGDLTSISFDWGETYEILEYLNAVREDSDENETIDELEDCLKRINHRFYLKKEAESRYSYEHKGLLKEDFNENISLDRGNRIRKNGKAEKDPNKQN